MVALLFSSCDASYRMGALLWFAIPDQLQIVWAVDSGTHPMEPGAHLQFHQEVLRISSGMRGRRLYFLYRPKGWEFVIISVRFQVVCH